MPYPDYSGGPTNYYQTDPLVDFPPSRFSGGGGDVHPWKITIINDPDFPETGRPKWVLSTTGTLIYDPSHLSLVTEDGVTNEGVTKGKYVNIELAALGIDITGESVIYFQYGIEDKNVTFEVASRDDGETEVWKRYLPEDAFADPNNIKDLTHSKTPIALIRNNPDLPDDPTPADRYIVTQLVRSNMVINDSCFNGQLLKVFIPM